MGEWYDELAELVWFATALDEGAFFSTTADVVRFFEKPWKWDEEHARWVRIGRPTQYSEPEDDCPICTGAMTRQPCSDGCAAELERRAEEHAKSELYASIRRHP